MRVLKQVLPAAAFLLAVSPWAAGQVRPGSHRPRVQYMRGAGHAGPAAAANPQNMTYNGGAVMPNSTTYAIWWGKPSDFPSDALDGLDDFLEGLEGSAYLGLADQYLFGQKAHTRFAGNLFDYSAPPAPADSQGNDLISPLVCGVLSAHGKTPDPASLYMIYASNYPQILGQLGVCAFHDNQVCPDGTNIHTIYVPNSAGFPGCGTNSDPLLTPNNQSEATRAMANATAHEFMETTTDPNFDGWVAPDGSEVGDTCEFVFQSWVPLTDGRWKIQEIWSNEAGGCVQGAGRAEGRVLGAFSNSGTITTFDIPAATYGTFAQSMNPAGAITGYYTDDTNEFHAFVRDAHGAISMIDPPGTGSGFYGGAQALSINAEGAITGNYGDTNFILHGFVRDIHGMYATFDVPGAAGTLPNSINAAGAVAGYYSDASGFPHGFVRDHHGSFATFDAPGAGNGMFGGTFVTSINANGAVAGYFLDANLVRHGFVRDSHGAITTFVAPGAGNAPGEGTFAYSINAEGDIAGHYTDASLRNHGFVRDSHGTFVTFDVPDAIYGTFAYSINAAGAVAGYYSDASGFPHGFVRDNRGTFVSIHAPGPSYGTVLRSISDAGAVAGYHTAPIH